MPDPIPSSIPGTRPATDTGAATTAPAAPAAPAPTPQPAAPAAPAPAPTPGDRDLAARRHAGDAFASVIAARTAPRSVTAFYKKDGAGEAHAAEGEVAARNVAAAEAGKARPQEALSPVEAHREVYLNEAGHFVLRAGDAGAPGTLKETGDGLHRAATIIDDTKANLLAGVPLATREKLMNNVDAALARVPARGPLPAGLDATQAKQLRSSGATVLLEAMTSLGDTGPEAAIKQRAFDRYVALARAETDPVLKDSMAMNLKAKEASLSPAQRTAATALHAEVAPTRPPYDKWFRAGEKPVVDIAWSVGSEFLTGNANMLKKAGWRQTSEDPPRFTKDVTKDGKTTTFNINLRYNRTDMFKEMADPDVEMVVYDGHADWGRNVRSALASAPDAQGAKVAMLGLCAGKGELNMMADKYPDAQTITTYNSSYFWTGAGGDVVRSENFEALMATVDGIAARKDWSAIADDTRRRAKIADHTVDNNYIFPTDNLTRRRNLDRDHDGQADLFDRYVDFSSFDVPQDTAREFTPKDAGRPADTIVGTRPHIAAMAINRNSYYNDVLKDLNPRGVVVPDGYFEPKAGERAIVKFVPDKAGGADALRMRVNGRFAHMSEESLRALSMYEFQRHLASASGRRWPYDATDTKLHGLLVLAHSLSRDSGYRDEAVWKGLLKNLNLPEIDRSKVESALSADSHWYSGSRAALAALRRDLPADVLRRLADPAVGIPDAAGNG